MSFSFQRFYHSGRSCWLFLVTLLLFLQSQPVLSSSQIIVCPGAIHFRVLTEFQRNDREYYFHTTASSVNDCVRKCFGNEFCFSAGFQPVANGSHICLYSYKSAYGCSWLNLTTSYADNSRDVIVECLKCPGAGEENVTAVTRAPVQASVDETIVVGDKEDCATPVTFQVRQPTAKVRDFAKVLDAKSPADCAKLCFSSKKCTGAGFVSLGDNSASGSCLLEAGRANGTCSKTERHYANYADTNPLLIECIQCGVIGKPDIQEAIESGPTTIETTIKLTTAAPRPCNSTIVSFQPRPVDKHVIFAEAANVSNAQQCASLCYKRANCEIAGYLPASADLKSPVCFLSAGLKRSCDNGSDYATTHSDSAGAAHLHCLTCGPVTAQHVEASTTTIQPTSAVPARANCSGVLNFIAVHPPHEKIKYFSQSVTAHNAYECAERCYARSDCHLAGYEAPEKAGEAGVCLISSGGPTPNCANAGRAASNYSYADAVHLVCITCGAHAIDEPPVTKATTVAVKPTTTVFATHCPLTVTFAVTEATIDLKRSTEFGSVLESGKTAADCAKTCFESKFCSKHRVAFDPASGSCITVDDGFQAKCSNASTGNASVAVTNLPNSRVAKYSGAKPVYLDCLKCEDACKGALAFTVSPPKTRVSDFFGQVNASSADVCAEQCYERQCQKAFFIPAESACLFSFAPDVARSCGNATKLFFHDAADPIVLDCVVCNASAPKPSKNVDVIQAITKAPLQAKPFQPSACVANLSYTISRATNELKHSAQFGNFTKDAGTVRQCADFCHSTPQCAKAGFDPDSGACVIISGVGGSASAGNSSCPSPRTTNPSYARGAVPVVIECISCLNHSVPDDATQTVFDVVASTVRPSEQNRTTAPSHATTNATTQVEEDCKTALSFVVSTATRQLKSVGFTVGKDANSTDECARFCYRTPACVQAGFNPESSYCILTKATTATNCAAAQSIVAPGAPTVIDCIRCGGVAKTSISAASHIDAAAQTKPVQLAGTTKQTEPRNQTAKPEAEDDGEEDEDEDEEGEHSGRTTAKPQSSAKPGFIATTHFVPGAGQTVKPSNYSGLSGASANASSALSKTTGAPRSVTTHKKDEDEDEDEDEASEEKPATKPPNGGANATSSSTASAGLHRVTASLTISNTTAKQADAVRTGDSEDDDEEDEEEERRSTIKSTTTSSSVVHDADRAECNRQQFRVSNYDARSPVILKCFRCNDNASSLAAFSDSHIEFARVEDSLDGNVTNAFALQARPGQKPASGDMLPPAKQLQLNAGAIYQPQVNGTKCNATIWFQVVVAGGRNFSVAQKLSAVLTQSVADCASACFASGGYCQFAAFGPTADGKGQCTLFSSFSACMLNGQPSVTSYVATETVEIICISCKSADGSIAVTNAPRPPFTATSFAAAAVAKQTATAKPPLHQARKFCSRLVTFYVERMPVSEMSQLPADLLPLQVDALTVAECARACFDAALPCASAGFVPEMAAFANLPRCFLLANARNDSCKGRPVTDFSSPLMEITSIACIRCVSDIAQSSDNEASRPFSRSKQLLIAHDTSTKDNANRNLQLLRKVHSATQEQKRASKLCSKPLKFYVRLPSKAEQANIPTDILARVEVASIAECAKACFEHNATNDEAACVATGFVPGLSAPAKTAANCFLLARARNSSCEGELTEGSAANQIVGLECIRCPDVEASVVSNAASSPQHPTPGHTSPARNATCSSGGKVSFQIQQLGAKDKYVFDIAFDAKSASDCARSCYANASCQIAGYLPELPAQDKGTCFVAQNASTCNAQQQRVSDYAGRKAVILACISCEAGQSAKSHVRRSKRQVSDFDLRPNSGIVDGSQRQDARRSCDLAYTLETLERFTERQLALALQIAKSQAAADSVEHCAKMCHRNKHALCSLAVFLRSKASPLAANSRGRCLLFESKRWEFAGLLPSLQNCSTSSSTSGERSSTLSSSSLLPSALEFKSFESRPILISCLHCRHF